MRVTKVKPSKNVAQHRAAPLKSTKPTAKPVAKSTKPANRSLPLAVSDKPAVKRGAAQPVIEPSPTTLDGQVSFHMRRAYQRTCSIFADLMGRFDLTPPQYSVIARIDEMGPMTQGRLERETALEASELLNVVGRLVRRGLIRPRPTPLDPRTIQLELTADAHAIMADMKAAIAKVNAKIVAPLSPAEAKTLRELLERCG
jgi:MarR family transcriptional regulator, lower aerobic nicotinate degradation pathway regulator